MIEYSVVEIIRARKSVFLHIDVYLYYKHSGSSRRYWNCRNKGKCPARAITTGDGDMLISCKGPNESPHSHAPNCDAVAAENALTRMKRKAEDHPETPPVQIMRAELQQMPSGN